MGLRRLAALLFDPEQFFENHPPARTLGGAFAVVALVAVAATVAFLAVGWLLASSIDATVTRTVVEPWSNSTCEMFAEMNESTNHSSIPEPCTIDEPITEQVRVGDVVWNGLVGRTPLVFVSVFLGWLLVAAALHVVSALFGAEGSFAATLSVAGWAMAPQFLQIVVGVVAAAATIPGTEFASDPELLLQQIKQLADTSFGLVGTAAGVVVTVWQVVIWTAGLQGARRLTRGDALATAAVVGTVVLLFVLLG